MLLSRTCGCVALRHQVGPAFAHMAVRRMFLPARNAATRSSGAWIAGRLRAIQPRQIDAGDRATAGGGGLIVARGLEADAEQRIRSAHRAIEIREKRIWAASIMNRTGGDSRA